MPLRKVTTQLRCAYLSLQTEAPASSPSVRGFFLPKKNPAASREPAMAAYCEELAARVTLGNRALPESSGLRF
jgi:hypothetical protein